MSETITVVATAAGRRYAVREADPDDEPAMWALFEAATAYFEAATGLPPGPADVQSLHYSLPPGADWRDRRVLVVTEEAPTSGGTPAIAGIIDVVLRFPKPDACSVGLFLLHPSLWGTTLGPALARGLLERAAASGIRRVTATVPSRWERGRRFLSSLSFTPAGPSPQDSAPQESAPTRLPAAGCLATRRADRQSELRPARTSRGKGRVAAGPRVARTGPGGRGRGILHDRRQGELLAAARESAGARVRDVASDPAWIGTPVDSKVQNPYW
ncbi:GNAT family protein [Streptomyces sp. NPDC001793]|uniref:GNAT family N-acetyltransferase n=1 Tax=Streptomyces sp. NPDC001793 TaxID=3154657 RepID=UPI00331C13C5